MGSSPVIVMFLLFSPDSKCLKSRQTGKAMMCRISHTSILNRNLFNLTTTNRKLCDYDIDLF